MMRTKLILTFMIGLVGVTGCDSQKGAPSEKAIPAVISQSSPAERGYGMDQVKRGVSCIRRLVQAVINPMLQVHQTGRSWTLKATIRHPL